MAQAERVAELVAGHVVSTAVIGEEHRVARVEVEVDLLMAAPSVAGGVHALRRIRGAVDPAGGAVLAVVVGVGDRIGLVGHGRLDDHRQLRRLVVRLVHRLPERVGQAIGQAGVEGDAVGQPVPDARAARRRDRAVAAEEGADLAPAVVAERRARSRVGHEADEERDHEQDDDATHGPAMLRRAPSRVKRMVDGS